MDPASTPSAEPPPQADAPIPRRVEWRRAWRALRNVVRDPERTDQVFALIRALSGGSGERLFQRFRASAEGRRLLRERPSLLAALSDRERLDALPLGSFGRAYADFMRAERLDAQGLADAAEAEPDVDRTLDPDRLFFFDRLRDMHDLWHVLTGYGRDIAGEAANLAFSQAQTGNRGLAVLVWTAALRGPKSLDCHWQRYLLRAWSRGRRAASLVGSPYEELLALPLDEVRRRLRIAPPAEAHPGGILVFPAQGGTPA